MVPRRGRVLLPPFEHDTTKVETNDREKFFVAGGSRATGPSSPSWQCAGGQQALAGIVATCDADLARIMQYATWIKTTCNNANNGNSTYKVKFSTRLALHRGAEREAVSGMGIQPSLGRYLCRGCGMTRSPPRQPEGRGSIAGEMGLWGRYLCSAIDSTDINGDGEDLKQWPSSLKLPHASGRQERGGYAPVKFDENESVSVPWGKVFLRPIHAMGVRFQSVFSACDASGTNTTQGRAMVRKCMFRGVRMQSLPSNACKNAVRGRYRAQICINGHGQLLLGSFHSQTFAAKVRTL